MSTFSFFVEYYSSYKLTGFFDMSLKPPVLAIPTFVAGPDDKLSTIDAYKLDSSQIINSISGLDSETIDFFSNFLSEVAKFDIDNFLKGLKINPKLDWNKIISNLFINDPRMLGIFRNLDTIIQKNFNTNDINNDTTKIKLANNTVYFVKSKDVNTIKTISEMVAIKDPTYTTSVTNQSISSGLISSISLEAFNVGLPGVFTSLSNTEPDRQIVLLAAVKLIPNILKTKNVDALEEIVNIPDIGKYLINYFPDIIGTLLTNFKIPPNIGEKDYASFFDKLMAIFAILDPNWDTTNRNGTPTLLIELLTRPNMEDFFKLVSAKTNTFNIVFGDLSAGFDPQTELPTFTDKSFYYKMAELFSYQTVTNRIKTHHPFLPIKVTELVKI